MNKLHFVEEDGKDVPARKKELRVYMKSRRAETENRDVKETFAVENVAALIDSLFLKTKGAGMRRKAFVYLSYSSEMPTDRLIERLLACDVEVYCPRMEKDGMSAVRYGEDFTLSSRGIREPVGEVYDGAMDFAIVPLLAVDKQGNRLGYGGGCYDAYFSKHPQTTRIAYCFETQILKSVPHTDTDVKMQYIITESRTLTVE